MLYGITRFERDDQQRRQREVELPGREAGVPVGRPSREAPWQQVIAEIGRPPHVRAGVATRGRGVTQQEAGLELPEHECAARDDNRDADPPLDTLVPGSLGPIGCHRVESVEELWFEIGLRRFAERLLRAHHAQVNMRSSSCGGNRVAYRGASGSTGLLSMPARGRSTVSRVRAPRTRRTREGSCALSGRTVGRN